MRAVVTQYKLGTLYTPGNAASLTAAVRMLLENYGTYADGIRAAATELNWEKDAATLVTAYADLTPTI